MIVNGNIKSVAHDTERGDSFRDKLFILFQGLVQN